MPTSQLMYMMYRDRGHVHQTELFSTRSVFIYPMNHAHSLHLVAFYCSFVWKDSSCIVQNQFIDSREPIRTSELILTSMNNEYTWVYLGLSYKPPQKKNTRPANTLSGFRGTNYALNAHKPKPRYNVI